MINDQNKVQFVVCIDNSDYPASLELHKIYQLVPDKEIELDGDVRIVDESGEDYIFSASRFVEIQLPVEVIQSFQNAA